MYVCIFLSLSLYIYIYIHMYRYCEVSTLTIFLIHVAISAGMVILAMPLRIKTASRFWFSCWTVFGLWLMLLFAVPRLHQATRIPFGYLLTLAMMCAHQAALDGWSKDYMLLSNAPIMIGIVMVAPTAGVTPTSAALYSCLGSYITISYNYIMCICVYIYIYMYVYIYIYTHIHILLYD